MLIHFALAGDKLTACGLPVKGQRTAFRRSAVTCTDCLKNMPAGYEGRRGFEDLTK